MRTKNISLLFLLPVFCAFALGIFYSNYHVGHQNSSSSGWFDLRALDPIAFMLQDLFWATIFAAVTFAGCHGINALLRPSTSYAVPISVGIAFALMGIHTVGWLVPDIKTKQEHEKLVAKGQEEVRQDKKRFDEIYSHLGWVKYPNLTDRNGLSAFSHQYQSCYMTFADDRETVFNYYLSRADSWELIAGGLTVRVQNEGYIFEVLMRADAFQFGEIRVPDNSRQLPNKGPTQWPIPGSEQTAKFDTNQPLTGEQRATLNEQMSKIKYPNGEISAKNGVATVSSTDNMATVLAFYRKQGCQQIDANADESPHHEFEATFNMDKIRISIETVGDRTNISTSTKR